MGLTRSLLVCVALTGVAARAAVLRPGAVVQPSALGARSAGAALRLRGGSEPSEAVLQATFACNRLYATCLAEANEGVALLRKMVATAEDLSGFGAKADALLADAQTRFDAGVPSASEEIAELYAAKKEELMAAVLASIEPAFVRALAEIKEASLEGFKASAIGQDDLVEAMNKADEAFVKGAKACVPAESSWGFKAERAALLGVMEVVKVQAKRAAQAKQTAQQQISTAMNYLQVQSQQMQAAQQQLAGGQNGKWSLSSAYRPPDTNINLSAAYQGGRLNVQAAMVPDEGAQQLGPNGFTNGVGPANLGLSMNVHL